MVPGTWSTHLMALRAIPFLCEAQEVSWSGITPLLCPLCHETPKTLPGPYHTHRSSTRQKIPLLERCHMETDELASGSLSGPSSLISFFHTWLYNLVP